MFKPDKLRSSVLPTELFQQYTYTHCDDSSCVNDGEYVESFSSVHHGEHGEGLQDEFSVVGLMIPSFSFSFDLFYNNHNFTHPSKHFRHCC